MRHQNPESKMLALCQQPHSHVCRMGQRSVFVRNCHLLPSSFPYLCHLGNRSSFSTANTHLHTHNTTPLKVTISDFLQQSEVRRFTLHWLETLKMHIICYDMMTRLDGEEQVSTVTKKNSSV